MTDAPDEAPIPPDPKDAEVAVLLAAARPEPSPRFRDALGQRLAIADPGWGPRPPYLWPQSVALVVVGAILLIVGALISVGGL